MFCDACTHHRACIEYLNPVLETQTDAGTSSSAVVHAQHRICAECAALRDDCILADSEEAKGNAGGPALLGVDNSALEVSLLSVKGTTIPDGEQLKVLLLFANETKYSCLSERDATDNSDEINITWNERFQFEITESGEDSTELFVEVLGGGEREDAVVASRKQRLLKHSKHGYASVHLDSLASARKLQSGAPISLDLPLLGGDSGGSIKIVVRIMNKELEIDEEDDEDVSSVNTEADEEAEEAHKLTADVARALSIHSDISDFDSSSERPVDPRSVLLADKAGSFKALAAAAHSLEDELSRAEEVDAMIRKLQYSVISDQEQDGVTQEESQACVELSRALTGKTESLAPAPEDNLDDSGSDESSTEESSEDEFSDEDSYDNDDEMKSPLRRGREADVVVMLDSSPGSGLDSSPSPQYAPPKVFIEKTKTYKKVSSRLMNPTRASEGSRWDKPINSAVHADHRDDPTGKKSAFRQAGSELFEKKGDCFEPSEYNNVSKFQLVQSRLLEPTKASLESRRGAPVVPAKPVPAAPSQRQKQQQPRGLVSTPSVRRADPLSSEDQSSLREPSVISTLSALTDTDSHVTAQEQPKPVGNATSGSHYAPPVIAKYGVKSYEHVQVRL